jgi:hypothetical protein
MVTSLADGKRHHKPPPVSSITRCPKSTASTLELGTHFSIVPSFDGMSDLEDASPVEVSGGGLVGELTLHFLRDGKSQHAVRRLPDGDCRMGASCGWVHDCQTTTPTAWYGGTAAGDGATVITIR